MVTFTVFWSVYNVPSLIFAIAITFCVVVVRRNLAAAAPRA